MVLNIFLPNSKFVFNLFKHRLVYNYWYNMSFIINICKNKIVFLSTFDKYGINISCAVSTFYMYYVNIFS
jgi:hypothetical protein